MFAVPIAFAATGSVLVSRALVPVRGGGSMIVRFAISFAFSVLILRLTDRLARRLLPLAVLWKLSLAFPTAAPSRWKVARQAANVKELERIAQQAREQGVVTEPAKAATHILALVAAVEAHDRGTRGHSERVRIYADLVAEELGLDDDDRNKLRWASLLHDVGKLMVPADVLNKPSKLDDREFDLVREHPAQGMRFVEPLRAWLGEWALAIEQHHERYDGKGYPHGLEGWRIARAARIVSVADSYEVMTARRPYKRPLKAAAARQELVACSGGQFDPAIVRAFLQISLGRLRLVAGPLAWLAQTPFLRGLESVASTAGAATTGGALVLGLVPTLPIVATPADVGFGSDRSITATAPSPGGEDDDDLFAPPPPGEPDPGATGSPEPSIEPTPQPSGVPTPTPEPTGSQRPTPSPTTTTTRDPGNDEPKPSGSPSPKTSPIATPSPTLPKNDDRPTPTPTGSPTGENDRTPSEDPSTIGRVPLPGISLPGGRP